MSYSAIAKALELTNAVATEVGVKASCPLAPWTHGSGTDSRPSFSINAHKGKYWYGCRACNHTGSIDDLLVELHGYTKDLKYVRLMPKMAKLEASDELEILPEAKIIELTEELYDIIPPVTDYKVSMDYCAARGISPETCDRLNLGYHPEKKRIVFNIYNYRGKLLGHTGRFIFKITGEYKDKVPKILTTALSGVKKTLLGIHKVDNSKPVILVEGLFMYARLHEFGLDEKYNILATMGTGVTKIQRELLISLSLPTYMMLDNDDSGNKAMFLGTNKLPPLKDMCEHMVVYKVTYPEGIKDPDDLIKDQIYAMIDSAEVIANKPKRRKINDIQSTRVQGEIQTGSNPKTKGESSKRSKI